MAAAGVYNHNAADASATSFAGISQAEGMYPAAVNDALRAHDGAFKRWLLDLGGTGTVGGTATGITLTLNEASYTGYGSSANQIPNGAIVSFKAGSASASGGTTITITSSGSLGSKKVLKGSGDAVAIGDWYAGDFPLLRYDTAADSATGAWILINSLEQKVGTTTPTPTASSGTFTSASAAITYTLIGRRCFVDGTLTVTTLGTAAGSFLVPAPFTNAGKAAHGSGVVTSSGVILTVFLSSGGTNITMLRGTGLTIGETCQFSINYDLAA